MASSDASYILGHHRFGGEYPSPAVSSFRALFDFLACAPPLDTSSLLYNGGGGESLGLVGNAV